MKLKFLFVLLAVVFALPSFAQDTAPCFDGTSYYMPPCMPDPGCGQACRPPGTLNCPGDCACGAGRPDCGTIVQDPREGQSIQKQKTPGQNWQVWTSRIPQLQRTVLLAGGQSSGNCSCYDTLLGQILCGLGLATQCQSNCNSSGCSIDYSRTKPTKLYTPILRNEAIENVALAAMKGIRW